MSDSVRLVNQQLAFCQAQLHSARSSDGFNQRCALQACKLQMHLLMHAYLAEIAERHGLKWAVKCSELTDAFDQLNALFEQKALVSADFAHLQHLINQQSPWHYWLQLSHSALTAGASAPISPVLSDAAVPLSSPIIASSQTIENPLNADASSQIELMHELLTALHEVIQLQRQNKIEF